MSNEVERFEESEISIMPPQQPPAQHAMAVLMEASQAMDVAWRYAQSVCRTQVCPARFRNKPEDGAAAILYGLEVGLSPAQSLQRVVVIHGMPSLEARTMVGLLQARGYQVSTHSIDDTHAEVWGWYPHSPKVFDPVGGWRINPDSTSRWDIARATQAGYVPTINTSTNKYRLNGSGKLIGNEKYITDPQAMLKAKAQAEVSRDLAPEVLMGIQYATEDLQSEQWDGTISVSRPRSAPVTVDEILSDAEPTAPEPDPRAVAAMQTVDEVNAMTPEEAGAAYDATETAQTVKGDRFYREPEAGPVESRVSTEQLAEEEPAEAPAPPVEPSPEADGWTAEQAVGPVAAELHAEADEEPEPIPGLPDAKVKQMFALLGQGGIKAKEDRLIVFRKLAERQDIGSTKDLTTRDLNKIVAKLKGFSDSKTITVDLEEIVWEAAQATAPATAPSSTEEK